MIVPRGLGGFKVSGGAGRLGHERKSPDGNLRGALGRTTAHDLGDCGVAAAAARACPRSLPDLFERACSVEHARANGPVTDGTAMANDHGDLGGQICITEKDFQYHFQN